MQENTFYDSPYILQREGSLPKGEKPKPKPKPKPVPKPEVQVDPSMPMGDIQTLGHQMRVNARTKEYEERAPKREAKRKMQEQEDAALVANLPEDVEDLTMDHILSMKKGGRGDWVFGRDLADKYIVQMNATDMSGRKLNVVSPEIQKALMTTFITKEPPVTTKRLVNSLVNTGDVIEGVSGIPAGDLVTLADAAYRGDKVTGGIAAASLGIPGAAGVAARKGGIAAAARAAGNKAREYTAAGISHVATDPRLRYRAAQTASDLNPNRVDPRVNVGNTSQVDGPMSSLEDFEGARTVASGHVEEVADLRKLESQTDELVDKLEYSQVARQRVEQEAIGELLLDEGISLDPSTLEYIERLRVNRPNATEDYLVGNAMRNGKLVITDAAGVRRFVYEGNLGDQLPQDSRVLDKLMGANANEAAIREQLKEIGDARGVLHAQLRATREAKHEMSMGAFEDNMNVPHLPSSPTAVTRPFPRPEQVEDLVTRVDNTLLHRGLIRTSAPAESQAHLKHLLESGLVPDPTMNRMATTLSKDPRLKNVPIVNARDGSIDPLIAGPSGGFFEPVTKVVVIKPMVTGAVVPTTIHELAHAVTYPALIRGRNIRRSQEVPLPSPGHHVIPPLGYEDTASLRLFDAINDIAFQVETRMKRANPNLKVNMSTTGMHARNDPTQLIEGLDYAYGGASVAEFISELYSNSKFRQFLKDTPYIHAGDEVISLFDRVLTKIADILKFTEEDTHALFASMDEVGRYLKKERKGPNYGPKGESLKPETAPYKSNFSPQE